MGWLMKVAVSRIKLIFAAMLALPVLALDAMRSESVPDTREDGLEIA